MTNLNNPKTLFATLSATAAILMGCTERPKTHDVVTWMGITAECPIEGLSPLSEDWYLVAHTGEKGRDAEWVSQQQAGVYYVRDKAGYPTEGYLGSNISSDNLHPPNKLEPVESLFNRGRKIIDMQPGVRMAADDLSAATGVENAAKILLEEAKRLCQKGTEPTGAQIRHNGDYYPEVQRRYYGLRGNIEVLNSQPH